MEKRQPDASGRKMPNYNKPLQVPPAAALLGNALVLGKRDCQPYLEKAEGIEKQHFVGILCC